MTPVLVYLFREQAIYFFVFAVYIYMWHNARDETVVGALLWARVAVSESCIETYVLSRYQFCF